MEGQQCLFLGIKVKPGPIERHKIENFGLDNTVDNLKSEAEKKSNVPSASLDLIHHGKILKDGTTLQDSGIKNGEMVHVLKKKVAAPTAEPEKYTDAELIQMVNAMRTFGCTPNAPGWLRAMQMLNDEATMSEIIDAVPSLAEDCVTLSILHEVELLAALGAKLATMRRGAEGRPDLPAGLRQLIKLVRAKSKDASATNEAVPTSGFAYSLEALSEDEDADEEDGEDGERNTITQEQLAAALQAASEAVSSSSGGGVGSGGGGQDGMLRLLRAARELNATGTLASQASSSQAITPEMFSEAISRAINRANVRDPAAAAASTPMEHSTQAASSSQAITPEMFSEISRAINRANVRDPAAAASTPMEHSTQAASSSQAITPEMFSEAISRAINRANVRDPAAAAASTPMEHSTQAASSSQAITPEMFSEAISRAINRANVRDPAAAAASTPMEHSTQALSSASPASPAHGGFTAQLQRMREMGLTDDALSVRALLICSGDVNAAINLVFSGAIGDD